MLSLWYGYETLTFSISRHVVRVDCGVEIPGQESIPVADHLYTWREAIAHVRREGAPLQVQLFGKVVWTTSR